LFFGQGFVRDLKSVFEKKFDLFQLLLALSLELALALISKFFYFLEQQRVNLYLTIKIKLYRPVVVRSDDIKP
jgi:hypothetical protein